MNLSFDHKPPEIEIASRDYWVKIVEFLQQNWALIAPGTDAGVTVFFLHDLSGVFDRLAFPNQEEAEAALARNGFERFAADPSLRTFLIPPRAPFHEDEHPNGPIYSSGEFWQ